MQQLFAKPDMPVKRVYQKPAQLRALAVCGHANAADNFSVVLGAPQTVFLLVVMQQKIVTRLCNVGFKRGGVAVFFFIKPPVQIGNVACVAGFYFGTQLNIVGRNLPAFG